MAALKKGAKIDGTSSSIVDSSNGLEQKLNDNKLVDRDEDINSNKDSDSSNDIPDTIQQRLEQLKLRNKPTSATDSASNYDHSEGRPNSIFSSDSPALGQKRTGLGSASSGYASEGVNHLPSTATDPIRLMPNLGKDNDYQNNEIKGISPAVTSNLQARLARLRSNLDKKRGGRTYKPLSRSNSRQQLLSAAASGTATPVNASEIQPNHDNHSAGSRRSSVYDTDIQKKLEALKSNLNEGSGLESRSGNSRVGSRRTSLFDHEDDIAKKLEDIKNNLDGTTPGLLQSSVQSYGGSNVGSNSPHKLNGLRTKTAIEV